MLRFLQLGERTGNTCRFSFFSALMVIVASIFTSVVEYKLICRRETLGSAYSLNYFE